MAALMDETMEGYVYPFYNDYSYHYQPPKGRRGAGPWRQQSRGVVVGGGGYFSGYDEGHAAAVAAAAAAEYLENYQREQLKAILAQVNPNLTPRMCKANTKEVGVQVNPRQDASVQCSLGSRPLLLQRRGGGSEQEHGSPVTGAPRAVRFPRTIAIYSSVASRRRILTTVVEETESAEPSPPPHVEQGADEKKPPATTPPQPAGEEGAEAKQDKGQLPAQPSEQADEEPGEQGAESGGQTASPPQDEGGAGKARARFQFLEQKYGYYHCKDCNIRWESAYVWCVQGTNKVYFRQLCRICEKSYNPYRVEDITSQASNDF